MKDFGSFSVLAMVIGIGFVCLLYSTQDGAFSSSGTTLTWQGNDVTATIKNRKLKEYGGHVPGLGESGMDKVNLEDYQPIDPVPSSKTSIKPGPIQHGTPLMPYIPQPQPAPAPPPSPSKPEGFP
ncbi:uncharacterized protein LOC116022928 [Ipomoea triloba]|uniref:uncharacterized protein LOC116022928 n=1 Tax=Ipomoea triloba TaxID=35885 RepID=UPI00125CEDBE|nr:uncharacterized protein LOC116022928 [Ipomoea triloba]GMC55164.1 Unconventional myosin-VIIb like [Ipomoea batatas]